MLGAIQRLNFTELILFNVHVNVDNEMVGLEFMLMLMLLLMVCLAHRLNFTELILFDVYIVNGMVGI